MATVRAFLDIDSANSPHEADVMRVANVCAGLFRIADKHIGFDIRPTDFAPLGDNSKAGVLMAAVELRESLMKSAKGRQALKDLGFEPRSEDVESE